MRRGVAAAAAVVLVLDAGVLALVNWVMGLAVRHQEMSLGGLAPSAMAIGAWVAGGLGALFLILCAVVLARAALRDRAPGRAGRLLLIACAVVHGVLGAGVVGVLGWPAFVVMMVVLALVVLSLVLYAADSPLLGDGNGGHGTDGDGATAPPAPPASDHPDPTPA